MTCPSCGSQAAAGARFCHECGTPLAGTAPPIREQRACRTCGATLSEEDRFCLECGVEQEPRAPAGADTAPDGTSSEPPGADPPATTGAAGEEPPRRRWIALALAASAVALAAGGATLVALKGNGDERGNGSGEERQNGNGGEPVRSEGSERRGALPPDAVAKVGDRTITRAEFDHWFAIAADTQPQGGQAGVPEPPGYEKCVASLRSQPPPGVAGRSSSEELERQCRQRYDALRDQVMQFLIQGLWVVEEAEERGVTVSDAEVTESFEDQKKNAFPKEADYRRFLEQSRMSEEDVVYRVKLERLQAKLTQQVTQGRARRSSEKKKALDAYVEDFRRRYRRETTCAAGFRTAECGNGPSESPTVGTAPKGPGSLLGGEGD